MNNYPKIHDIYVKILNPEFIIKITNVIPSTAMVEFEVYFENSNQPHIYSMLLTELNSSYVLESIWLNEFDELKKQNEELSNLMNDEKDHTLIGRLSFLPGMGKSGYIKRIIPKTIELCIDTSGSISDEDFKAFHDILKKNTTGKESLFNNPDKSIIIDSIASISTLPKKNKKTITNNTKINKGNDFINKKMNNKKGW